MSYRAVFRRTANGRKPTMKELMTALKEEPGEVYLKNLSVFPGWEGYADCIPAGTLVDVVGPDPQYDRRWYVTLRRGPDGKPVSAR